LRHLRRERKPDVRFLRRTGKKRGSHRPITRGGACPQAPSRGGVSSARTKGAEDSLGREKKGGSLRKTAVAKAGRTCCWSPSHLVADRGEEKTGDYDLMKKGALLTIKRRPMRAQGKKKRKKKRPATNYRILPRPSKKTLLIAPRSKEALREKERGEPSLNSMNLS